MLELKCCKDRELLEFCIKKLLIPGWAGELNPEEFPYIKAPLKLSPSLKRRWGFRPSAKRFSEARIREVARYGVIAKAKVFFSFSTADRPLRLSSLGISPEIPTDL